MLNFAMRIYCMIIYFISGLAADSSVFNAIRLPAGYEARYLDWIPAQKNESLPHYALRLAEKIDNKQPFALAGLSFGGMLAVEIAKQYKPAFTILLASIPLSKQLPVYYKLAGKLGLHKVVPVSLATNPVIAKWFFSAKSEADRAMIKDIVQEIDISFIRWGMDAILKWKNNVKPEPLWHIHGTKDSILPVRYTSPSHTIPGAGHLFVSGNSEKINQLLTEILTPALA